LVEATDCLERGVAAEQRLPAGDHRFADSELDRLLDDPMPGSVVEPWRSLQGAARGVGVAEAASEVAVIGQLELGAVRALRDRLRLPPKAEGPTHARARIPSKRPACRCESSFHVRTATRAPMRESRSANDAGCQSPRLSLVSSLRRPRFFVRFVPAESTSVID